MFCMVIYAEGGGMNYMPCVIKSFLAATWPNVLRRPLSVQPLLVNLRIPSWNKHFPSLHLDGMTSLLIAGKWLQRTNYNRQFEGRGYRLSFQWLGRIFKEWQGRFFPPRGPGPPTKSTGGSEVGGRLSIWQSFRVCPTAAGGKML